MKLQNIEFSFEYLDNKKEEEVLKTIERQVYDEYYPVNVYELRNFSYYGLTTEALRPNLWKIFLGHLIKNKYKNKKLLKARRREYCKHLSACNDHLKLHPDVFNVLKDDVNRMVVFLVEAPNIVNKCYFLDQKINEKTHRENIIEILSVFSTSNPSMKYVQGMNCLLLPIYFVFANSKDEETRMFAKEDAFFCFYRLIHEKEVFKPEKIKDESLMKRVKLIYMILEDLDPVLYNHLEKIKVLDSMFCYRWILLMFYQEFELNQVIYLWDRFLADVNRFEMLDFCVVATVLLMRDFLMENGHDSCLEKLQGSKKVDAEEMFAKADDLRYIYYQKKMK